MFVAIRSRQFVVDCENHYPGFGAVRTREKKTVYVMGAPRVYQEPERRETSDGVIRAGDNSKSAAVVEKLLPLEVTQWGKHLTGHYLLLVHCADTHRCFIITDLGNSFHLYQFRSDDGKSFCACTHIDRLAAAVGEPEPDYVSLVEALVQDSVSYPYSGYAGIREAPYACCIACDFSSDCVTTDESQYWQPTAHSDEVRHDLEELAVELRRGLTRCMEDVLADQRNVLLFLSGGVDSRVLAELISALGIGGTAITVVDSHNKEAEIAARVAAANGLRHHVILRELEYYSEGIDDFMQLEGPHTPFSRSLFLGFRDRIRAIGPTTVVGGYMSDTLFKLHEANVKAKHLLGRHLGVLEKFDQTDLEELRGGENDRRRLAHIFRPELLEEAGHRRKRLMEYWQNLRTDGSAWEWSYMWPYSRNKHNSNLTTHIFSYPAYEVYSDRALVEVARVASRRVKLNGRLFNRAVFPLIRNSRRIPDATTGLPLRGSAFLNESLITLKHLPPRRWMFREPPALRSRNPAATNRSHPDLSVVWNRSLGLSELRKEYDSFDLERKVMSPHKLSVFDLDRYEGLSKGRRFHIMYMLLHLDRWNKRRRLHFISEDRSLTAGGEG